MRMFQEKLSMPDLIDKRLGNYRFIRLLGHGGFADVYLGQHIYLHTLAAVKVLRAPMQGTNMGQFLREARIIAHLSHPNIVHVLDFVVQDDMAFLIMDYAPNGSLRQRCPQGMQMSLKSVLYCARQVGAALQYAHNHKIIHQDVKPQNMLLGADHQVLLGDFGIAVFERHLNTQKTSLLFGTVPYMAPEQFSGQPCRASDQYALAVVVYKWLSGVYPFQGSSAAVAYQHLHVAPPPLRKYAPDIHLAIERVVLKALAKEPTQRFASVHEFVCALEEASELQIASKRWWAVLLSLLTFVCTGCK